MDSIADGLQLGWDALLLREGAYERMRAVANPVVKGLIFIIIIGFAIALLGLVGDVLEWATTPDLGAIKDTVYHHLTQMTWWRELSTSREFVEQFDEFYNLGWQMGDLFGATSLASSALDILLTPLGLVIRWLIYGLLAYLFARWLGGTGDLSDTLGVLALAAAPQMLNVFTLLPYVSVGLLIPVWGILCAYVGLKTAHNLPWHRAVWATLLPFLLALVVLLLASCLGTAILAVVAKGG
ncbi:MAG: YIP1 family protein [Anaerolineae bacterium]|nr:YIP1 family protein [Anaerolineae bacterium]